MSDAKDCIGAVDIGGTKIAVGLVSSDGSVLSQRSLPTSSVEGWRRGVEAIAAALTECGRELGLRPRMIGVGCTGPVDPLSGVIGQVSLLPGWEGCDLTSALHDRTGVEVALENDADAAALAEFAWGSGRGAHRFLYVTVSTGIGAGLICDGTVYRGAGGAHPEMGHHAIDPVGPLCYCGVRGCWESLASGTAIERHFSESRVRAGLSPQAMSARSIFELAQDGDPTARMVIDQFLRYLGIGLANVSTMLVPDIVALGGGVMQSMDPYLADLRRVVQSRCGEVPMQGTEIRVAALEMHVGLAGAAAVAIARYGWPRLIDGE